MSSPILDLSYRNYDGPLDPPLSRWWVIARVGIRQSLRKRVMWVLTLLSGWYYAIMMIVLFFMTRPGSGGGSEQGAAMVDSLIKRVVWKDQFVHGISYGQFPLMLAGLLLGAGVIANDNRANALLVYLSKPVTKLDYLIGKWVGVFVPMLIVIGLPTLIFYLYGLLSYQEFGFFRDDPWLFPRLLIIVPLCAAMYTSLVVGISSLFNQTRIAGFTFAMTYILTYLFTTLMRGLWVMQNVHSDGGTRGPDVLNNLSYLSIDGIPIGFAKGVLGTKGSGPFVQPVADGMLSPAPPLWMTGFALVGLILVGLAVTWRRVRAVEVVG